MAVGSRAPSLVDSSTHPRLSEYRRRPHVSRGSPRRRVATAPRDCSPNMGTVRESRGGPVRITCERAVSPMVFSTSPGRTATRDRRFCAPVARGSPVRISTAVLHSPTASPCENRRAVNHIDSPRPPRGSVVRGDDSNVDCAIMANSTSTGRNVSGGRHDRAMASDRPATEGLAPERDRLERRGLSDSVIRTIQGSRASSTYRTYASRWNVFSQWCVTENVDPVCCQVESVLSFLQFMFDKQRSPATIKVFAAAISACHEGFGRDTVFSHPLVKRFLLGTRRLRPVARATLPQWDLTLVLEALCETPFEPLNQIPLKMLSLKTALLLALTTAKRVSDLCALSTRPDCLAINGDLSRAVLRPNPAFTPKVIKNSYRSQTVELWAFSPPPHEERTEERLHRLCPVRALACYVQRTAMIRSSPQLFVCHGANALGRPLSKQRLSHWLCEGIETAYEAAGRTMPHGVRAHSTRGVAASTALFRGIGVEDICAAASWSSPSPFIRFYLLDMSSNSLARSVLSVVEDRT